MVNDGIRCAVCGMPEPALHSIDCPRHDFDTCAECSVSDAMRSFMQAYRLSVSHLARVNDLRRGSQT